MPQPTAVPALCASNSGNCAAQPQSLANHPNWSTAKSTHTSTGRSNVLLPVDVINTSLATGLRESKSKPTAPDQLFWQ
jgi:hypothetical protein